MAHQASPIVYKDDYNKNVLGQGPANPAIAFPENDRLKKIHDQTTKVKYLQSYETKIKNKIKKYQYHFSQNTKKTQEKSFKRICFQSMHLSSSVQNKLLKTRAM